MRVTLERAALMKSLGRVHRVVERRTTIPILGNVLVRADQGGLRLQATDLDIEVVETVPAGGLNLWARLPDGTDVDAVVRECESRGLVISPGAE